MNKILYIILFWSVTANATETVTLTYNYKNIAIAVRLSKNPIFQQ